MAGNVFEEVLRLVLETRGQDAADSLRQALEGVGDVSDETGQALVKLVDEFEQLNKQAGAAAQFEGLTDALATTEQQLNAAERSAYQLALQLAETAEPSRQLQRSQATARAEVDRLRKSYDDQFGALVRLDGELKAAGVDTAQLATAQERLRNQAGRAAAELERQAQSVQREASARAALRQRLEEGDAAFRQQARTTQAAAQALEAYRARQAAAAQGAGQLEGATGRVGSAFGRLRGVLAPIAAYLTFDAAKQGISNLLGVAAGAEDARRALTEMYGSVDAGNRAYGELRGLAKSNGVAFDELFKSARVLKNMGLDPLGGSLEALVDQNAATGGSMDDLQGKALGLGQAWAKQKLQTEEILQLVERGVPVWDLLEKATGRNAAALQKMASDGELTRTTITALIEEIAKANDGAAERSLGGISGLLSQISARWLDFRQQVVDAGVGTYLKQQLQSLLDATGGMDGLAKRVSAGIISTLEAVKSLGASLAPVAQGVGNLTLWLAKNAEALAVLAKAYAGVKLVGFYQSMASGLLTLRETDLAMRSTAASAGQAGGALGRLGGIVASIPRTLGIGVVALGIDSIIRDLSEIIRLRNEAKQIESDIRVIQASQRANEAERVRQAQQMQLLYARYASTVIASNEQIKNQSLEQAEAYRQQLLGAQAYFQAVIRQAVNSGQAVDASVGASIQRVNAALKQVEAQIKVTSEAFRKASTDLSAFSVAAVANFDTLISKGKSAKEAVSTIFDGVDFTRADGIKNAIGILDQMSARGTAAARAVRTELRAALKEVSSEDLPAFQVAADAAFTASSAGAKTLREELGKINLARLGVDLEQIQTGYSQAGRAAVDAFKAANGEVERLGLTAAQRSQAISAAFKGAFKDASSSTELKALRQALSQALSAGNINTADFQAAMGQVDEGLANLASNGTRVGDSLEEGANRGARAYDNLASSAQNAASSAGSVAEGAEASGKAMEKASSQAMNFSFSIGEVSKAYMDVVQNIRPLDPNDFLKMFARATNELTAQREQLNGMIDDQRKLLAEYDQDAERRAALRLQFGYVGDGEIEALIAAEKSVAQAEEERARKREEASRAQREQMAAEAQAAEQRRKQDIERINALEKAADAQQRLTDAASPGAARTRNSDLGVITIKWDIPRAQSGSTSGQELTAIAAKVAELASPLILAKLRQSRDVSNSRSTR